LTFSIASLSTPASSFDQKPFARQKPTSNNAFASNTLDGADVTALPDEMGEDCGVVARTSPHLTNAIPSLDVELIEEIRPECRRAVIDTFPQHRLGNALQS
jgi:hypothetical protein